nr:glycerophosphodiester phosphodiesterase family protein [uncultured Pedobacter sp.]
MKNEEPPIILATNPVIAHRGAWKERGLPENSIASLREAINLKCHGSEFDVHLTADDVLVVNHDQNFYGLNIEKCTYQQLLSKKHPNGEYIPTAEEYLKEGLKQNHTKLIFELKESERSKARTLEAAEKAVDLLNRLDKNGIVEFISFDYDALKKIKALMPHVQLAYLNGDITPQQVKADGLTGIDYEIPFYKKNPSWISDAQAMGLKVNAWTVNQKEDMLYFIDQGADNITTNFPARLFELLINKNS